MRQFLTILLFLPLSITTLAQSEKISQSELDSLYLKTIQSRYFFLLNVTIYVEINQFTERLRSIKGLDYLAFMTNEQLIKESLKSKKQLDVIRLVHRHISSDTIDINIGYLKVKAKRALTFNQGLKFTKADFQLSCGGTNGYVPTCRFYYDSELDKWIKLENEELKGTGFLIDFAR